MTDNLLNLLLKYGLRNDYETYQIVQTKLRCSKQL